MIEDEEVIVQGSTAGNQLIEGPCDAARPKVAPRVVIAPDNQDAKVVALRFDDQVMQLLEVVVIAGEEDSRLADRMPQVDRVSRPARPSAIGNTTSWSALRNNCASSG